MKNLGTMKVSNEWRQFLIKLQAYRVTEETDITLTYLQELPDLIAKYFKLNNDRYLELVNLEKENGIK